MGFLFADSLAQNKSRFVKMSGKILEVVLLSVGFISIMLVMKEAVLGYSCAFVFTSLMGFWSSIRCCFLSSSLTTIITINVMVALIFASSSFYGRRDAHRNLTLFGEEYLPLPSPPPLWDVVQITLSPPGPDWMDRPCPPPQQPPPPPPTIPMITNNTTSTGSTSSSNLESLFSKGEKTDEFEAATPRRRPLERWKDVFVEETMDATWEAISKREKPKLKAKKKRERGPPRRLDSEEVVPTSPKWKELRKAETFNDAVSLTRRGGLVRRDPSMTLEDFNRKVDTFINNFKRSIRSVHH